MQKMWQSGRMIAGGLAMASALGLGSVAAQEATPDAAMEMAQQMFPAGLYEGTCSNLAADPSYELADVTYGPLGPESMTGGIGDATPIAGQLAAQDEVVPVGIGATSLEITLTDLFVGNEQYAVGVSDPESGEIITCGNVGGPLFQAAGQTRTSLDEARLLSGLREVNGSGYSGVAWIQSPEGGAGESTSTTVTIFLLPPAGN